MVHLRRGVGAGFWGSLLDCFACSSLWVAVPFAALLGDGWKERLLLWLALSAGAIVIEQLTIRPPATPPALFIEDQEEDNVLLRKEEKRISGSGIAPATFLTDSEYGVRLTSHASSTSSF
jgi:hypothetical protein